MSEDNPVRIFVAHAFSEHPDYLRVFEYLESSPNFFYKNCSDPGRIPASGGREAMKEELRRQIQDAEIMIVPAALYPEQIDWLKYEMDAAQAMGVPTIAVEPFGGIAEVHADVAARAGDVVSWNERLIVDAVRQHARGEDTTRFETIEFEMP